MTRLAAALLLGLLPVLASAQPATTPVTQPSVPSTQPVAPTTLPAPATAPAAVPLPPPLPPAPAPAAQPKGLEVRDNGHFFDAETLARANARIEQIHRRFGKEVVVETYDAVPDDRKQRFGQLPKGEFFQEWLKDRAGARNADGVFILICRNPGHVQVAAGSHTRERIFTTDNVRELDDVILAAFRKQEYGLGLMRGLNQIEQRMEKNTGK